MTWWPSFWDRSKHAAGTTKPLQANAKRRHKRQVERVSRRRNRGGYWLRKRSGR